MAEVGNHRQTCTRVEPDVLLEPLFIQHSGWTKEAISTTDLWQGQEHLQPLGILWRSEPSYGIPALRKSISRLLNSLIKVTRTGTQENPFVPQPPKL
jgi:hypothetical protein